jgi:type IV pilus assembly protein PilB
MAGSFVTDDELKTLLVDQMELVDAAEFEKAQQMATRLKIPLERALAERGRFPLAFLLAQLAQAWDVGFIELKVGDVQLDALQIIREEYARNHGVVPFERQDRTLKVAMANPRDRMIIREIAQMTKHEVVPYLAPEGAIRRAQLLYKGNLREMLERSALRASTAITRPAKGAGPEIAPGAQWHGAADQATRRSAPPAEASAADLVTRVLEYAVVTRASDIHIEPFELETLVRYRIDGVLHEVLTLPPAAHPSLIARIKILSAMRIDEHRIAQDGRFEADLSGFVVDLRVSAVPTQWGEKIVVRVLSREAASADLDDLGLAAPDYELLIKSLLRPFGMILVTGPTGSGKSTTLYAMLRRLSIERQNAINISTVEDPIEYTMPRVNQIPLNAAAGFDFASALRALLRQDPDVIMVGEIRDSETVSIGVRAALVGRLFLSTLHTNDATSAVPRLLDMGVEPFLLASTLVLVMAQRLARRICMACRESAEPEPRLLAALRARPDFERSVRVLQTQGVLGQGGDPFAAVRTFRGRGCAQCQGSGFRGRIGVFELFEVREEMRQLIMERRDGGAIRAAATQAGMRTMFEDGLAKVLLGETTLEEVYRVAL